MSLQTIMVEHDDVGKRRTHLSLVRTKCMALPCKWILRVGLDQSAVMTRPLSFILGIMEIRGPHKLAASVERAISDSGFQIADRL